MDIVVAGSEDSIVMVEGAALEISEEEFVEVLNVAHPAIKELIGFQRELVEMAGGAREKFEYEASKPPEGLEEAVGNRAAAQVQTALRIADKAEREAVLSELREEIVAALEEEYGDEVGRVRGIIRDLEKKEMRRQILEENVRVDGRGLDDIREINVDVGVLPRTHGSALFTRGQTQALCVTTLGTINDEQRIDSIDLPGETSKSFMLHYNFPPFSVGEVRMFRGPGRREIGHGMLAEKALQSLLPPYDDFPYTIRIVSDILESNGSSSMATVCGGSLALMDAGVPLRGPVAGIAMGLVKEGEEVAVLTDILGVEDALGDMDFKVAGTERGITSIQMDIKAKGLSVETMQEALERARKARLRRSARSSGPRGRRSAESRRRPAPSSTSRIPGSSRSLRFRATWVGPRERWWKPSWRNRKSVASTRAW
jgi:polyribonucleotide nucleotidyltransferase